MRKGWFLLLLLPVLIGAAVLVKGRASARLSQVEFVVAEKDSPWKVEISRYLFSFVHPGQKLTPDYLETLRKRIEALPWVEECEIEVEGGKLKVRVRETVPELVMVFRGKSYLVGKNGFVLGEGVKNERRCPIIFYRGKGPPFKTVNGFLRLKRSVKMELNLVKHKLKEIGLNGRSLEVSLTDTGVQLSFKNSPVLVYVGIEERGWQYFEELLKKGFLKPGFYDFRFDQMLVMKGRQEKCSDRKP